MRLYTTLILFLSFTAADYAQIRDTVHLWPGKVPGENEEKHEPVQTPDTRGNVIRLTDVNNPALIVFEPEVPVEIHLLPEGGHGYGMRRGNIAAETWPILAEDWLKQVVLDK